MSSRRCSVSSSATVRPTATRHADAIAALYPGYNRDNVLVTNGSAEANFVTKPNLLERGDEIVVMLPNYMLVWGLACSLGMKVAPFHLREDRDWHIDVAELEDQVSDRTRMIVICNPTIPPVPS